LDEVVAHTRERITLPNPGEIEVVQRLKTSVPEGTDYHPYLPREDGRLPMSDFGGVHRYNVTGLTHDMWGFPSTNPKIVYGLMRHLVDKIEGHTRAITRIKVFSVDDAEFLLISYGSSARTALHLVRNRRARGERLGLLELQTLWPFPTEVVRECCAQAKSVIVVEMNMGQIFHEVKAAVDDPEKVFLANQINGAYINPTDVLNVLRIIQGRGI
jgi:2-oxoglutarate ferredoxin oxidoreductase subunit alpha